MSKVEIVMNRAGVAALLKSPGIAADVRARANRIAAAAGPGIEARSGIGRTRARASVVTVTYEGMLAELQNRRLSSAIGAGG